MNGEQELYPVVESYLRRNFKCHKTAVNTGTSYAHVDVIGLRERRNNFAGNFELVAVEVKRGAAPFLKSIGQSLGYSLYAHRVYLAWEKPDKKPIVQEEIDIASAFGVGLLSVHSDGRTTSGYRVKHITTSHEFKPERHYFLQIVDKLKHFECTICRSFYPKESDMVDINRGPINISVSANERDKFRDAVESGKPGRYWLYQLAAHHKDERQYVRAIVKSGVRGFVHAAALRSSMVSMPSWNGTPSMTLASCRKPRSRRQDFSAQRPIL